MTLRPADHEFAPYYSRYISLVTETDILRALEEQATQLAGLMDGVPPEREEFRYAPDKWSVREVLGHLIDGERVFGYRAFCISRGETAPLPSFDQSQYITRSDYKERSVAELMQEFLLIRRTNVLFLRRLSEADWSQMGTASNHPVSVRALAFIMVGHARHHVNVLRASYGVAAEA
ncbi:MAG TPA: DinB family protein [bacterium]|nr:DinB family protein [bacterium]HPR87811.1 DinB family protein [bacterium]